MKYNEKCPDKVREAFSEILDLKMKNASGEYSWYMDPITCSCPTGWANITQAFNLCYPLNSTDDVRYSDSYM